MIEVYLFLAAFTAQILAMSVLYPVRFTGRIRTELTSISAERLAEAYPGVNVGHTYERFLARYRAANTVIVVLGLLLLGWFFSHMQHPNWDESTVGAMLTAYFVLQNCPLLLIAWLVARFNKVHRRSLPETKRKAILQRRGLFDFVSPLTVFLAILSFLQFVVFLFYIARHPFPNFGGPFANIAVITPMYVLSAFAGSGDMGPLRGNCVFLLLGLLCLRSSSAPPRQPEADGLGSNPVR